MIANTKANIASSVVLTGLVRTILGYREGSLMIFYSRAKVWTAYHICIGIVCASLPISGPLVQRAKSLCCSRKKKEVNFSYPLRPNAKSVQTPEVALVL